MSKIIVDQIEGLSSQLVTFNDGISVTGSVSISGQNALTNAIASIQNDTDNNRIVITDALGTVSYLDLSSYLDDTNDFVTAAELDTITGVLTLTRNSGSEVTVDIGYDTLQSNINLEEGARIAADSVLQVNINNEASARGAADTLLQSNIDTEEAARIAADTTLQNNITAEATARTNADAVLQGGIDAEGLTRQTADADLQSQITSNDTDIAGLDTRLTTAEGNIASNDTDIAALDGRLTTAESSVGTEEAARIAADTTLQNNIDAEATTRSNADTTLQNNIDSETTDRIAADATLQAQIDATDGNLSNYQLLSEKGQANGYAGLDANGLVPSGQLPSFVDDVIEAANFAALPGTGEAGKIYVTIDSGNVYRWGGSAYIQINDAVSSADQATKLATARSFSLSGDVTANAVSFDGSGNVVLATTVGQAAVTQHQGALTISQSQISDLTFPTPNNSTISISGGTGLTGSGSFTLDQSANGSVTISHGDTSPLASGDLSAPSGAFITSLNIDDYGHIQSISTGTPAAPSLTLDDVLTNGNTTTQWITVGRVAVGNNALTSSTLELNGFNLYQYSSSRLDISHYQGATGKRVYLWVDTVETYYNLQVGNNITASGTIQGGTVNATGNIFAGGQIRANDDIVAYNSSDARLKDNVREIPNSLDKVKSIRGVHFNWNDNQDTYKHGSADIGVIAQEVEAVLPDIVTTRDNGYKAVKYEKLTAVLIEAVKELSNKVEQLENKLNGTTN